MMEQLDRITQQPSVMGGKACIRGQRVTVGMIVGQIGTGRSVEELLADYPYLVREDVMQALRYAAWRAEEGRIISEPESQAACLGDLVAGIVPGNTHAEVDFGPTVGEQSI